MTNFAHAKYGPDTVRIDDPTYVVPLLTEDVTVGTGLAFPAAAEFEAYKERKAKGELVKGIGWVKRAKGDKLPKIVQE